MAVQVDKSGRDNQPGGVEDLALPVSRAVPQGIINFCRWPDARNLLAVEQYIQIRVRASRRIDDAAVANPQHGWIPFSVRSPRNLRLLWRAEWRHRRFQSIRRAAPFE